MVQISIEQQIRNILTDMEIEDAQKFTAGDLCELANILADKIKFEQELHMIDELLARRPALADFDTRIDRISYAIKVASQKDALKQRCREAEEHAGTRWKELDAERQSHTITKRELEGARQRCRELEARLIERWP